MRILLTNDDGFDADGLKTLFEAVKTEGEVAVSAPDKPASASGHSISLNTPFKVVRASWSGTPHAYRVFSTPADCIRVAVLKLLPWKPDLVISGINQGANYGSLVLYSGTVAAAAEAVLLGIPAIAVSLTSHVYRDQTKALGGGVSPERECPSPGHAANPWCRTHAPGTVPTCGRPGTQRRHGEPLQLCAQQPQRAGCGASGFGRGSRESRVHFRHAIAPGPDREKSFPAVRRLAVGRKTMILEINWNDDLPSIKICPKKTSNVSKFSER
jgi:hypothetical protein